MSKAIKIKDRGAWDTIDELNWIDSMGKVLSDRTGREEGSKTQYLTGYLNSCKSRVDWGNVDKEVCVRMAKDTLRQVRHGY